MSSSSTTTETKLPMATILHMLTIKLSSTNYLYWQNQLLPLLANQELLGHVDGSIPLPPKTITLDSKEQPNPAHSAWLVSDQQAVLILNSSLTEEAVAEILGLSTARQIWTALEAAYSNTSLERMHLLRDNLRQLTKGSSTVAVYGRKFKAICDQLSAIGHPVSDTDKTHWFLCGLGPTFESWSTAIRTAREPLSFRELLTKAESQEQFLLTLHPPTPPTVAFVAQQTHHRSSGSPANRSRSGSTGSGSYNRGSNPSKGTRRPPHCQLCRTNGHYANKCPKLSSFVASTSDSEGIARAFHAQCHVSNDDEPDWIADTGADIHMTDNTGSKNKPTSRSRLGCLSFTSILPKPNLCSPCQLAKAHKLPFEANEKRASNPLDLVHCDLWGPSPIITNDGYKYYVVFVDDYSRFSWLYPLKTKTEFYTVLQTFLRLVQTQLSRKVKVFQSDGGTEFTNKIVQKFFNENGTFQRFSCPYTAAQNGRAERKHRHIVETGLAMLFHARVPITHWVDAFSTATYIINRLPTKVLNEKSPFEMLFSITPSYTNFRVFGCCVYPYLRDYAPHKLAPRSIPCIFLGYAPQYKGYKCFDPASSRMYVTRHARFDENFFPYVSSSSHTNIANLFLSTFNEPTSFSPPSSPTPNQTNHTSPPTSSPSCCICDHHPSTQLHPSTSSTDNSSSSPTSSSPTSPLISSLNTPPSSPTISPTSSTSSSLSHISDSAPSPVAPPHPMAIKVLQKNPHWIHAMQTEYNALHKNCTWTLVPRPSTTNIVGSKWVFRIKYRPDGSIGRHKARLVAQGFTQIPGLDFNHTFSPVVKASTIRIVLSLAVINGWSLKQLDVDNAFLNGHISETIYMEQPPGFVDPKLPNHVCKLNKALYGLKQAPRAWFHRLSTFLLSYGFKCSRADPSLFIFLDGDSIMYLLVYVDDLILTGNKSTLLSNFTTRLHQEFAIKDLGSLNYFLGLEVMHTTKGLFLSQTKYANDILARAGLTDTKPVPTPLSTSDTFTKEGTPYSDPTLYRSLVGALQYLTITRPDLSYAVNQACQHLHSPTEKHFQLVKRILRYVKGTISHGLVFTRPTTPSILGYSDADWARCIETRRSTYGYSVFLGGNLVSWSAKKQPTVSRSSCESEYRAMANAAAEIVWITHLLQELHALPPSRPTLLCDNKSALFMSQNPVSHKRAKHIDLDYHFVRELVMSGKLHTKFIPTKLQLADIFTKSLPRPLFEQFRDLLRVQPPPFRLQGDNNQCQSSPPTTPTISLNHT
ncbi:hypothetical protein QVD17_26351 [Tagetes erecta]|uniref:Integrase catalytic domain-containing protein n=1 Tax=Tagetes erecta TaxID=13708 RepID=A0AAD8NQQ8_TARER|nr:hypothetical protein QVD17_26351 [Tagetes erecta]